MALSGLHVTCSYGGGPGFRGKSYDVLNAPVWSETMPVPSVSSNRAPPRDDVPRNILGRIGEPIFSVRPSVDAWVSFGSEPNAGANPRRFIPANTEYEFFVQPGDKLAWMAA